MNVFIKCNNLYECNVVKFKVYRKFFMLAEKNRVAARHNDRCGQTVGPTLHHDQIRKHTFMYWQVGLCLIATVEHCLTHMETRTHYNQDFFDRAE